jgi:hypothetical protein
VKPVGAALGDSEGFSDVVVACKGCGRETRVVAQVVPMIMRLNDIRKRAGLPTLLRSQVMYCDEADKPMDERGLSPLSCSAKQRHRFVEAPPVRVVTRKASGVDRV